MLLTPEYLNPICWSSNSQFFQNIHANTQKLTNKPNTKLQSRHTNILLYLYFLFIFLRTEGSFLSVEWLVIFSNSIFQERGENGIIII